MFVKCFDFSPKSTNPFAYPEAILAFFQNWILYASVILLILCIISIILTKTTLTDDKFKVIFNALKFLNIFVLSFIFILVFFKFIHYLWYFKTYSMFLSSKVSSLIQLKWFTNNLNITINGSILSDTIVLLAFSSGIVCLYLLGEKNLAKHLSNITIFSIFLVATIIMVYTTNLLVMFIGFECLFLPTLYFVYSHGYVARTDKTLKILLYWTLFGAFLVLSTLAYLFFKYKTLNYYHLIAINFTELENQILYIAIFIGFGVKVPVFPFHYWLTKIHVEAPAGFSIFLSGFLVKAAIYCFYIFNLIFESLLSQQLVTLVALFGVVESSIKMWTQTDFKKLIAFATIQEMNLILFLLINFQNTLDYSLILFILIHGWLSTLMFFLVDIIQKKTHSRNIVEVSGLAYTFPGIKLLIWFIILLFSGFPLTVKFAIEWQVVGIFVLQTKTIMIFCFFIIVVIGVMGFAKQMIILLYGMPRSGVVINSTISKKDKKLFYFIMSLLILLNVINFLLG